MSEAPCITTIPMNVRKPGSCGILPSNTDAKIIDSSSGKTLGPGEVGELCVRGPQVTFTLLECLDKLKLFYC